MNRDWSQPGILVSSRGLYEPAHEKGTNVVPEYRFFNGMSYFYQFGDAAEPGADGRVVMSAPIGDIHDEGVKVYAFKRHLATQPIDQDNRLLPLKIGLFFQTGDIRQAVIKGAEAVGWMYERHGFADTERYMGLFHEVAPKEDALTCNSCHNGGSRLNFAALGYTPKSMPDGRSICASCHDGSEPNEWTADDFFRNVHGKHVNGEGHDCGECHTFSSAR
jgi:hypothetical protein